MSHQIGRQIKIQEEIKMVSDKDKSSPLVGKLTVINVGLDKFASELADQGVPVIHVDWKPPASGNPILATLLSKMGT